VAWSAPSWNATAPSEAPEESASDVQPEAESAGASDDGAVVEPLALDSPALVLSGRVVLNISPVPDFDRLLGLDGALGRIPFVRNVTLADYAKEEVTFRLELEESASVEEFTSELSQSAGQTLEVTAVAPGQLQLRIVRAGLA